MRRTAFQWIRTAIIGLVSAAAVFVVHWFAPSLFNASINTHFRLRGELPAPEDIVIVAIDDASIQRVGKYPWSRGVTAKALNKISSGQPKAIGLDIIYAEESDAEDDERLAAAIEKNGRVVLPVQLFENSSESAPGQTEVVWLNPLPEFDRAAAGKGHAHAAPGEDGTLRSIQLSKADDKGKRFWAFGLEILRVAEQIRADDYEEKPEVLRFGSYDIRLLPNEAEGAAIPGVSVVRSNEMLVNYIGATKSFRYYSFADVLNGEIPPETFAGKIVLIGATSPTLGDAQVTPFMHFAAADDREGGQAMPGVEVHANLINTIKNRLWLRFLPGYWDFGITLLIILGATAAVKLFDGWRQVAVLILIFLAIVGGSLIAFNNYFLILPLPEMLTAFVTIVPLLLLDRSLSASHDLDLKLSALSEVQKGFLPDENELFNEQKSLRSFVPHNLEWKLRAVDDITTRLLSRMSFINRVLTGMNEGVLVALTSNKIAFVNDCFTEMFDVEARNLINRDFTEVFLQRNILGAEELRAAIEKVLAGENYEKEFAAAMPEERHYFLRMSPVTADAAALDDFKSSPETVQNAGVIGILILLSDVTKQYEFDRLKAEMVQLVSHELRSPLTSIQGLSDVLRKFPVSGEESKEMLATIHSEAVRLNELINRFLDIERLESGVQDLHKSPVNINSLVESCVLAVNPAAAEKGIKIGQIVNRRLPELEADPQLLAQAIGNLLSNAVKYSPPQTTITVETVKAASEIQIIVSDNGYGIPPNALERIFDKFYRLERDAASETIGSGLGLSFVKEVAEKHDGRVVAESEENAGSTFILSLPC